MATLDDVLSLQKTSHVLFPPAVKNRLAASKLDESVSDTLTVSLYNSTSSNAVYAYITGLAISNNHSLFLLGSDGSTPYYPENPASNGSALATDCAILLGAPGTTRDVTIPYIAGGRIWFCVGSTLTFLLNPSPYGPGLVEPSVSNTADPNYLLTWDFCEFTYSSYQLYANITYVDFVCLPISLTVTSSTGASYNVTGIASNGLDTICSKLKAQNVVDNAGWDQLVITNNGSNLRALSPTNGILFNPSLFKDYWSSYIDEVWEQYNSTDLTVNTQATWGVVGGNTSDGTSLAFSTLGAFPKPTAADIFGAASGAFAAQETNTDVLLNIGARLDAGFNRSTLITSRNQPLLISASATSSQVVGTYYSNSVTNHYARIVHAANIDGKGYCFPYDDVTPDGGEDQSGFISDPTPTNFRVAVGGSNSFSKKDVRTRTLQQHQGIKRSIAWEMADAKPPLVGEVTNRDVEKGELEKLYDDRHATPSTKHFGLPPILERLLGPYLTEFRATPVLMEQIRSVLSLLQRFLMPFMSSSVRIFMTRIFVALLLLLFYILGSLPHGSESSAQRRILENSFLTNGTVSAQLV